MGVLTLGDEAVIGDDAIIGDEGYMGEDAIIGDEGTAGDDTAKGDDVTCGLGTIIVAEDASGFLTVLAGGAGGGACLGPRGGSARTLSLLQCTGGLTGGEVRLGVGPSVGFPCLVATGGGRGAGENTEGDGADDVTLGENMLTDDEVTIIGDVSVTESFLGADVGDRILLW